MKNIHLKKLTVPVWVLVVSYGLLAWKIYDVGEEAQKEKRKANRRIAKLQGEATRATTNKWKTRAAARRS